MENQPLIINWEGKQYALYLQEFDTDINVEEILKIDYSNIMGEVLTFSVFLNRIGNLKAEYEFIVNTADFDLKVFKAQKEREKRKALTYTVDGGAKGSTKLKEPTVAEVEAEVLGDQEYKVKYYNLLTLRKNLSIIESIYWSAKSKDDKLNKLSDKLRPEEFSGELLQDTVNGVLVKNFKSQMKDELSNKKRR